MKVLIAILTIGLVFLYHGASAIYAQYNLADLPADSTCDLCGACTDAEGNTVKPDDWQKCRDCLYQGDTPVEGKSWTPLGCISSESGAFVSTILRFTISIASGLAFLTLLWGGFQLLTAAGDPGRIESGKHTIMGAIGALLLLLFSVFLLQMIGISILGIPGLG